MIRSIKQPTVEINDEGVSLYGKQLGHKPCSSDVLNAMPYSASRSFLKMDGTRELFVFDEAGIVFLREVDPDVVYNIAFEFERPSWRKAWPEDPASFFRNPIRVGKVVFTPPIHRKIADKVSGQIFQDLTFYFVCQSQEVAALSVGFPLNEAKVDPDLKAPFHKE
ncbi:MAG: hypothetical protein AAGK14_15555 [Verrucomicrobiota bacterium]